MIGGVEIRPSSGPLGAEVECDLRALDAAARQTIRQAWLDHLYLVFHAQELSEGDLVAVSAIFGEPEVAAVKPKDDLYQRLAVISNVAEDGKPIGVLGAGELRLHSDHSFQERPLSASILYAREIPAEGGDTHFSNMYAALETLPKELRARVEGLTIKNDPSHNSAGERRTDAVVTDVRAYEGPSHPIVRTHPDTRFEALYLGRRPNAYVNGLSVEASEQLLNELWAQASQARFSSAHHWRVGDVVVWDNRCVMHRRDAFDTRARRVMLRAQCAGERPFHDPGAAHPEPHPRSRLTPVA